MRFILYQTLFLAACLFFRAFVRAWQHHRSLRAEEAKRELQAAREREWRVGIPYDPDKP